VADEDRVWLDAFLSKLRATQTFSAQAA
jgi:hypothetical protein